MEGLSTYSDSEDQDGDESYSSSSESSTKKETQVQAREIENIKATKPITSTAGTEPTLQSRPLEPEPSKKRKLLPSASALLAGTSGKPSFLQSASNAPVFEIPEVEKPSGSGKVADQVPIVQEEADKNPTPTISGSGGGASRSTPSAPISTSDKDKDKKNDVKDKLKAARLKGQSAHARWKSEGEMLLRQQYD
jgi:hypothetical protein